MKKEELKKAFDKEFENITVSAELKEKTLKAINDSSNIKHSHLPYLKNFAAVFVVTMLCLSIYLTRNEPQKNINLEINSEAESISDINTQTPAIANETNESYAIEEVKLPQKSIQRNNKKYNQETDSLQQKTTSQKNLLMMKAPILEKQDSDNMILQDFGTLETTQSENNNISEEEFLTTYPNAEKIENGYKIYENNKEIIYVFNNGFLENTIILE